MSNTTPSRRRTCVRQAYRLPGAARFQREWWGGVDPLASQSPQADSWTLASRTATVNMSAQVVVFDRRNGLLLS